MSKLQRVDKVVDSVIWCRNANQDMTDSEFARWYEKRYKVPEERVRSILILSQREEHEPCTD